MILCVAVFKNCYLLVLVKMPLSLPWHIYCLVFAGFLLPDVYLIYW